MSSAPTPGPALSEPSPGVMGVGRAEGSSGSGGLAGLGGLAEDGTSTGGGASGGFGIDWSCLLELSAPHKNVGRPTGFGKVLCRTGLVPRKASRVSSINDSVKLRRATVSPSRWASIESASCSAIA